MAPSSSYRTMGRRSSPASASRWITCDVVSAEGRPMIAAEDPGVSTNLISMADEPLESTVLLVWTLETLTLLALATLAAAVQVSGHSL